jgi:Ribosomal protein S3AE
MNESNAWFKVSSPEFDNMHLGDMFGNSSNLVGRKLELNATELKELKPKFGYKLMFKVSKIAGTGVCEAALDGTVLSRESISRMIRHNVSKRDVVLPVLIADKKYAVKVIYVVGKNERRYRKFADEELKNAIEKEAEKTTLKDLVIEVLTSRLQTRLLKKLNKIYPTRSVEVRMIEPI